MIGTPAMIMQFGGHIVDAGATSKTAEDVVESFIGARLDRHAALEQSIVALREQAEKVAYRMVIDDVDQPVRAQDAAPLLAAQLGRVERGVFAFRFAVLQTYLAAAYVIHTQPAIVVADIVRNETTREVLLGALRRADSVYAGSLVQAIEKLVREHGSPPDDLHASTLPPVGSFRWSPVVLQYIDYSALGMVILAAGVVVLRRDTAKLASVDVVGRQVFDGTVTDEELLIELTERAERGQSELTQLLKMLAAAPQGALLHCVRMLQSFDNLLEFFERTLPVPTKVTIHSPLKPDMWRYAPKTQPSRLLEWAVEFDRKHAGFLVKMANSERHRVMLSRAIDNATVEVPRFSADAPSSAS
jgi:hypothetical protein